MHLKLTKKFFVFISLLIIVIHLLILLTTEFIDWPELLLYPWLLSKGFILYKYLPIPYQPLPLLILNLYYFFFGFSVSTLRLFQLFFVISFDIFLFVILYKLTKSKFATFFSLMFYIFWQPMLEGNGLWFDQFTLPFLLSGYYFTLIALKKSKSTREIIFAGIAIGLALITKQTTAYILLGLLMFILLMIIIRKKNYLIKLTKIVLLALLLPLIQLVLMFLLGIGKEYIFWTIKFPINLRSDPNYIINPNIVGDYPQIALVIIGIILLLFAFYIVRSEKFELIYSLVWLISSLLLIFPRWTLTHLQIPYLFLTLSYAETIKSLDQINFNRLQKIIILLLGMILLVFILRNEKRYIYDHFNKENRFYNKNTKSIINQIKLIKGNDSYFLFGNTEYYYAYMQEPPLIKPYIQLFPWNTGIPGTQEELINKLEKIDIKYVFLLPYHQNNIYYNGTRPEKIFQHLEKYYYLLPEKVANLNIFVKKN